MSSKTSYLIIGAGLTGIINVLLSKRKNKELSDQYNNEIKRIKSEYILSLKQEFTNEKINFFKSEILKDNLIDCNELYKKIGLCNSTDNLIDTRIKQIINGINFSQNSTHFNILVIGPTGVGKSALINNTLGLIKDSDNYAEEGVGNIVTLGEPKPYENNLINGLRLYDTCGIDIGKHNIEYLFNTVNSLINNNSEEGDPDKFIHCIWYCINSQGNRFIGAERDFLVQLMKIYQDKNLPIIIVLTLSTCEKDIKNMTKEIEKICKENEELANREIEIVPVLSKDKEEGFNNNKFVVNKHGINKLLEVTFNKIQNSVESAYFHSLRQQINTSLNNLITNIYQKIVEDIEIQLKQTNINVINIIINTLSQIYNNLLLSNLNDNSIQIIMQELNNILNKANDHTSKLVEKKVKEKAVNFFNQFIMNEYKTQALYKKINDGVINSFMNILNKKIRFFKSLGIETGSDYIKYKISNRRRI